MPKNGNGGYRMKFFHMADLHLGRKLLGEPLWKEQQYILSQVLNMADEEKPEALLLCGDIYDKSIPSSEAVGLLDWFLEEMSVRGIQTFLISGNHDGARRLQFASGILSKEGIHIAGTFKGGPEHIVLNDAYGPVHVWMLPFLRPGMLRPFVEEIPETYEEAVKTALKSAVLQREERNLLLAHQFVTAGGRKPEISDSEQHSLGGIDQMDASVFEGFDYVALGHIHRSQKMGNVKIRYAGSPLKYSFSEWNQTKSVTVAELREKGNLSVRKLPLEPKTEMAVLKDTMEALASEKYWKYREGYYLSVVMTDEEILEHPMERLRKIFPGMLEFAVENRRSSSGGIMGGAELQCLKKTPFDLFREFYEKQNGIPMSDTEQELLGYVIKSMEEVEG